MMALAPADRAKLARILGMLGSAHQGERDAAALAADRLVRGRGLDWSDVLEASGKPVTPGYGFSSGPVPSHIGDLQTCGHRPDLLTAWECAFITGLAARKVVSNRQREILTEIALRVRAAGPRHG